MLWNSLSPSSSSSQFLTCCVKWSTNDVTLKIHNTKNTTLPHNCTTTNNTWSSVKPRIIQNAFSLGATETKTASTSHFGQGESTLTWHNLVVVRSNTKTTFPAWTRTWHMLKLTFSLQKTHNHIHRESDSQVHGQAIYLATDGNLCDSRSRKVFFFRSRCCGYHLLYFRVGSINSKASVHRLNRKKSEFCLPRGNLSLSTF